MNQSKKISDKSENSPHDSGLDRLLIIDRSIDLVTPFCTGLTYESLLDSLIGINHGHAYLDSDLVESGLVQVNSQSSKRKVSMSFNSSDHVYKDVRDLNIYNVLGKLNIIARKIKDGWQSVKGKEVQHLHNYVQQSLCTHVQESQLLPRHMNIVNKLRDTVYDLTFRKMLIIEREILEGKNHVPYIENCLIHQESWIKVLRMACLQSLVGNGINQKALDSLRRNIVHTYGFDFILTLESLEKLKILKPSKENINIWPKLVKKFNLIVNEEQVNIYEDPTDVSYTTSGYAPVSVRVVETAVKPGWIKSKELLSHLSKVLICKVKQTGKYSSNNLERVTIYNNPNHKKVMMVFFTGGVTHLEISALRFLSQKKDFPYHIIIASNTIINSKNILQSIAYKSKAHIR